MPGKPILTLGLIAGLVVVYGTASLFQPRLLLFPHHRTIGATTVYSDAPVDDDAVAVIGRADALVRGSALFEPDVLDHPVFLTDGGWRWRVLAFQTPTAFAQTRPLSQAIVVNRSSPARDRVFSGDGAARSLSAVIAHERTHALIRDRFGLVASAAFPVWVVEGYCDHVAGSSTLSDTEAARLVAEGRRTPALVYYQSRKRVDATLEDNGGSVEQLFRTAR